MMIKGPKAILIHPEPKSECNRRRWATIPGGFAAFSPDGKVRFLWLHSFCSIKWLKEK